VQYDFESVNKTEHDWINIGLSPIYGYIVGSDFIDAAAATTTSIFDFM